LEVNTSECSDDRAPGEPAPDGELVSNASEETARNKLAQLRQWAGSLQRELDDEAKAREKARTRLQAKDDELQSMRRRLVADHHASRRRLEAANAERERLAAEVSRLERERATVQSILDAVLSSRGWKLANTLRLPLLKIRQKLASVHRTTRSLGQREPSRGAARAPAQISESQQVAQVVTASSGSRVHPDYQRWMDEYEPSVAELARQRKLAETFVNRPVFSVILTVSQVEHAHLRDCVQSVTDQTYPDWELCISCAPTADLRNVEYLRELTRQDRRIHLTELSQDRGISRNSNAALERATGDFVTFLDAGDMLASFCLFEVASALQWSPDLDLLYSDHDHLDANGVRCEPLFKPHWSRDMIISENYISRLGVLRRTLVLKLDLFDPDADGAQDWDLFLRAVEQTQRISHIAHVLYHSRLRPGSVARNDSARDACLFAIGRHLEAFGLDAEPEIDGNGLIHARFKRPPSDLISIIIPTRDRVDLLSRCITSLLEVTDYPNFEIFIVDNGSSELETLEYLAELEADDRIRVIWFPGKFNYSAVNNTAVRMARGKFLLFLNNDVEITRRDWLIELAGWARFQPVGIVGGKLLRADGTIQHAGVVLGMNGFADHPFADQPALTFGLAGSTGWYRNFLAVTGACMMMRREVFDQLDGFDENFILCGSDVEMCLRACALGYRVVCNPFAELIHHEQQTRGHDIPVSDYKESLNHYSRWLLDEDPFWNSNLSRWSKQPVLRRRDEASSFDFATEQVAALTNTRSQASEIPLRYPNEEELFADWFDCSNGQFECLRERADQLTGFISVKRIVWFIPPFENPYYGGVFTILRFAKYWRDRKDVENLFAICGTMDRNDALDRIRLIYPGLLSSQLYVLRNKEEAAYLPEVDASICTLWITPYYALYHCGAARRFYLIQDFEPAFYKAGSASALVESTYRMGLYGIANTISLKKMYESEYGGKAMHFTPCVDEHIFFPSKLRKQRNPQGPWLVFIYGRPGHPRNSFELLGAAMKELKRSFGSRVRIVSAGSNWKPADYGLDGIVENLGTLSFEDSGRLYREADLGVVMMLTRHPSYIPLELMASGCLVVTNLNAWTTWLLKDGENCLLTSATATSIAETVRRGLLDASLRERITNSALAMIRSGYLDWSRQMENVYDYLCDPEAYLQTEQPADNSSDAATTELHTLGLQASAT
jgi:O-antigen biosynthesis protein